MINAVLEICENCKFYHYTQPYIEIDLFNNHRKRQARKYCKWFGKALRKKDPACGIFKQIGKRV